MNRLLQHACQRLVAAYSTHPPALPVQAWVAVAAFAAVSLPLGLQNDTLQIKVEKRMAVWAKVRVVPWSGCAFVFVPNGTGTICDLGLMTRALGTCSTP